MRRNRAGFGSKNGGGGKCEPTSVSIKNNGGDVLKYMGDGLLAVFPIDEYVGDEQQVCSHVLEAAHESRPAWPV
jgi:hypothetical protein